MKIRFLKFKNWLLSGMMGVLGLSACHSQKDVTDSRQDISNTPSEIDRPVPMYGVPQRPMETTQYMDSSHQKIEDEAAGNTPKVVDSQPPREPQVTVYGVPTVDFNVKGRVTDANGKPVKGLQVIFIDSRIDPENLPENEYWDAELRRMSDTTDTKGEFEVNASDRPWEQMRVLVRDIDGVKNGSFQDQLVDVQFGEPEAGDKPVSKWKLGTKHAEVTIKMKRKKK